MQRTPQASTCARARTSSAQSHQGLRPSAAALAQVAAWCPVVGWMKA